MDVEYQAGAEGLRYAAEKGLAVVVMEPLRGGRLTKSIPPSVQEIWQGSPVQRTPAEHALQWVWNQPEVSVVLSGMSNFEQVQQNVETAERSGPGTLTEEELALYVQVRKEYEALCPIPCTDCKYCLPCPSGVNIPRVFDVYNDAIIYDSEERAQMAYNNFMSEDERANLCTECGECLEKCPQEIEIPDWLAKAHEMLCQED
jgi:predicted aldo/keto reductase-like oxidoreductase